jgi:hypothetical protein
MLPRGTRLRGLTATSSVRPSGASRLRCLLHRRNIGTLNPERLTSADFVNMSGMKAYRIKPGQDKVHFICRGDSRLAFPEGTQGFLYFIPGPAHAPVAGEVRFRTTTEPDPAGFADGRDLLLPHMPVPWSISLINLLSSKSKYDHLCNVIFEQDGSARVELANAIREHKDGLTRGDTRVVNSLGQPFIQDLHTKTMNLRIASGSRIFDAIAFTLPSDSRRENEELQWPYRGTLGGQSHNVAPLTIKCIGRIKCCLEAITRRGIQGIAVRVLEIVEPVELEQEDYDGWLPPPVAGELLKTAGGEVWTHILRESHATAPSLRALMSGAPTDGYVIRASSHSEPADSSGPRPYGCVRNLAPDKLAASDWMDLSLQTNTKINVYDHGSGTRGTMQDVRYGPLRTAPFPRGTTGFIYLRMPGPDHPIGAQLRFRVVPEPNPAAFAAGHDLRAEDGTTWSRWLPPILIQQGARVLGDTLARIVTREGLIDRTVVDRWRSGGGTVQRPIGKKSGRGPGASLVCPGSDPFLLDLAVAAPTINLGVGSCARGTRIYSFIPSHIREQLDQGEGYSSRLS